MRWVAAAATDALGLFASRIAAGLRSFTLDTVANPGRLNLYERRGTLVLIDFAHNEVGLQGLLDVSRQLTARRGSGRGTAPWQGASGAGHGRRPDR